MAKKEYIERGALLKRMFPIGMPNNGAYPINAKAVKVAIEQAPAADVVEVRHGEWVRHKENCLYNKCSICSYEHCREDNYCPNCGAKMDGERKKI